MPAANYLKASITDKYAFVYTIFWVYLYKNVIYL